jgi:hypothetical protein
MPLTPVDAVGLAVVGATSTASTIGAQSAKFAGLMRDKLRSTKPAGSAIANPGSVAPFQLPNGNSLNTSHLRSSVKSDLKQIQSRMTADAAQNRIDIGAGVALQVDSSGLTHVLSGSQQQTSLEGLIASDSQLESMLSAVAQKVRVLQAAESVNGTSSSGQNSFKNTLSQLSGPLANVTISVNAQRTSAFASTGT